MSLRTPNVATTTPVKRQRSDSSSSLHHHHHQQHDDRPSAEFRPLAVTCTHCRARKIKCDNAKPSCGNCIKAGHDCTYLAKQKPGLKAGTGETMLKRIEALESEFTRYRYTSEQRLMDLEAWRHTDHRSFRDSIPGDSVQPQPPPPPLGSSHRQPPPPSSTSDVHEAIDYNKADNRMGPPPPPSSNFDAQLFDPIFGYSSRPDVGLHPPSNGSKPNRPGDNFGANSNSHLSEPRTSVRSESTSDQVPCQHQYSNTRGSVDQLTTELVSPFEEPVWRHGNTLPRPDIVRHLIATYFEKVAKWTFIVIEHDSDDWEPPWSPVVHGMVVLAVRFTQDPRVLEFREQIASAAKNEIYLQAMNHLSLQVLQALALVSVDVLGSNQGVEGWGCISLLTRSAVTADLLREQDSVEPEHHPNVNNQYDTRRTPSALSRMSILQRPADWKEEEARRRLFWLIFALDRYTCTTSAIDTAIPAQDIKRRLPCADSLWRQDGYYTSPTFISPLNLYGRTTASLAALHPATYFVEALDLMGRAHALQSNPVDTQDARAMEGRKEATTAIVGAANRWYMDIESQIGKVDEIEKEIEPLHLMTHAIYHATLLKLQSFHAYPALATTESIVEPFASHCLESARAITTLSYRATSAIHKQGVSPIFIWCCWVAARVLFIQSCLSSQVQIAPEFKALIASMSDMASQWQLAAEYVRLLERAERKWNSLASTLDQSPASGSLSEAVSVLLDLKKTGAQALRVGKYDVSPMEPVPPFDTAATSGSIGGGGGGGAGPQWPRGGNVPTYGEVQNWFDSLDLFPSPSGFGPV